MPLFIAPTYFHIQLSSTPHQTQRFVTTLITMFNKFVTRKRRSANSTPVSSPVTTPATSPTTKVDAREVTVNNQLAVIDEKITQWEIRAITQREKLKQTLSEISQLKSTNRKVPESLKKSYGRQKEAVRTTEAQIGKLRTKHDDVALAADLAILADTIGNANSVVDELHPGLEAVGDVLATAASQSEEAALAAQALAEAGGGIDDVDIDDEIEQFERENALLTPMVVEKHEEKMNSRIEDTASEVDIEESRDVRAAVPA